jgi:superfamily II DNA or RNA helicase
LQTWGRGDGLLGMQAHGVFGPRGGQVTVVRVDWTYTSSDGLFWATPAPVSVWARRAEAPAQQVDHAGVAQAVECDPAAEADARDWLQDSPLRPLDPEWLQWRAPHLAALHAPAEVPLWTLPQEELFGDFWAEQLPSWQAQGWQVRVRGSFAHQSTPVTAWCLSLRAEDDWSAVGQDRELASRLPSPTPVVQALGGPRRQGGWLLTLGVEVDGEALDLAPMLADLLRRDRRWLDLHQLRAIDPASVIVLKAPGGRRIEAPAGPLKAIVAHLLDLLTAPRRREGPLRVARADGARLLALQDGLAQAGTTGAPPPWALPDVAELSPRAPHDRSKAGPPPPVAAPASLCLTLRPYQLEGLAWLQHLRAQDMGGVLADDMGLGKTAQTLAHLLTEQAAGRLDRPALVVMPTSLLFGWRDEAARIAPSLRCLIWHGAGRARQLPAIADHDLVLTTYPVLWRDIDRLAAERFHFVVLDEAQWVKNAGSRAAAAVRRLDTRHRLCLSGTPLENHLGELWALFDFLMPGFLGDAREFRRAWRDPIERNGETVRAELLALRLRPHVLRRRKAEVARELPPRIEVLERLPVGARQKSLYETVRLAADKQVRQALARQGFDGAQIAILDALLKLRQVCADPRLVADIGAGQSPGAKLVWLRENVPEMVDEGRRLLIFSQFTSLLDLVRGALDEAGVPMLHLTGETPAAARAEAVAAFQAGQAPVMLISLRAGGVGLTLTAADTVVLLDPWWNPAVENQATDRAHRLGQTRTVTVYRLVLAGSIEERILALQARKQALADVVLGAPSQAGATPWDEADLAALMAPLS